MLTVIGCIREGSIVAATGCSNGGRRNWYSPMGCASTGTSCSEEDSDGDSNVTQVWAQDGAGDESELCWRYYTL